jgi:hypothetical protein
MEDANMDVGKARTAVASVVAVLAAGALIAPGIAAAAKQSYAPGKQARNFDGGAGGWTATDSNATLGGGALCILSGVVLCPEATSEHQATGGVGDSGHLNAHFEILVGVSGTATSVWGSKPFTYKGVKGKKPSSVMFKAQRSTSLSELLTLPSQGATYTAEIVPEGGGAAIAAGGGGLPTTEDWDPLEPVSISPGDLTRGQSYSIRITTEYESGIVALAGAGDVGYDNVVLVAKRGTGGGGGGGGFTRQIRKGVGPSVVQGKFLFVRVKCPKSAPDTCKFRTTASFRKHSARIAGPGRATGAPGDKGYMRLKVKPSARNKLANRSRVFAHVKVTSGSEEANLTKRVTVKH